MQDIGYLTVHIRVNIMVEIKNLVNKLRSYNRAYRKGSPVVYDSEYDRGVELLRSLDPSNTFLNRVEIEEFKDKNKVAHSLHMLSIQKVYDILALERFVKRVKKEAKEVRVNNITFRLTAKLDGLAGNDNGKMLISRGDGKFGYNISNMFSKGLVPIGGRGRGLGEIVVVKSYFQEHMTKFFRHPRNMVVGIVSSEKLNVNAKKALDCGKVHFVPYAQMESIQVNDKELLEQYLDLYKVLLKDIDYPVDGVVAEVTNNVLRNLMGSTTHHYRWQAAIKTKGEIAKTLVNNIIWQVGRSGMVTPVLEIEPVLISGATIRRVTAHNAGNVMALKIGIGSVVKIIRSGEVIPKLESVIKAADSVEIPVSCPACHEKLNWNNLFLTCPNYFCVARVKQRIAHWFRTLGNAKWLGTKTVQKMVEGGYSTLEFIYKLSHEDLILLGFGQVQSRNIYDAIHQSLTNPVNDWRFLAAFGIPCLGLGDSHKLLREFSIYEIPNLKKEMIVRISGFGNKTSKLIEDGIKKLRNTISNIIKMEFNLLITPSSNKILSLIIPTLFGKQIVFTGKMETGLQNELKSKALGVGLKVKSKVSKNVSYLVRGSNGSKSKLLSAESAGIPILTEKQYLDFLDKNTSNNQTWSNTKTTCVNVDLSKQVGDVIK